MSSHLRPAGRLRSVRSLLRSCLAAVLTAIAPSVFAEDEPPRQDLTPIPVSRSFNLIGIGVGFIPEFSGSNEYRPMVLPVVRVAYKDKIFWNALQAGAWLWDSDDKDLRIGLAIEPRFGWEAEAGTRVAGMDKRDFSFEGGPNVQWRTGLGVINANVYQDLGGASDGQTAQLQFIRALVTSPTLRLNGSVGLQWFSASMNDYYFGVRATEATPGRARYSAGSSTNLQVGLNGSYSLTQRSSLLFGVIASRLGDGAARSPIVETRLQGLVYFGYGWSF